MLHALNIHDFHHATESMSATSEHGKEGQGKSPSLFPFKTSLYLLISSSVNVPMGASPVVQEPSSQGLFKFVANGCKA